jgi:hypothetical protein
LTVVDVVGASSFRGQLYAPWGTERPRATAPSFFSFAQQLAHTGADPFIYKGAWGGMRVCEQAAQQPGHGGQLRAAAAMAGDGYEGGSPIVRSLLRWWRGGRSS